MKTPCKNCKQRYKNLTEQGLCGFCFREQHGHWSKDFSGDKDGKDRNHMKFNKEKK